MAADGNSVIAVQTSGGFGSTGPSTAPDNWHGEAGRRQRHHVFPALDHPGRQRCRHRAQGGSNSLDLYWQANGASGWDARRWRAPRTTYSPPRWSVNGNSREHRRRGTGHSLDFYWAVNGSSTWNPEVVAGAGSIASAPAMVAQGGGVNIVARRDNALWLVFYWAFNGSRTWTPSDLAGVEGGGQPAIVAYPGRPGGVHIMAIGGFLAGVAEETAVSGSSTWQETTVCAGSPLSGKDCAGGDPSATMNGGLLNLAVTAQDGDLDFWWQDWSGSWHLETRRHRPPTRSPAAGPAPPPQGCGTVRRPG